MPGNGSFPGETFWVDPGCLGSTPGSQQCISRYVLGTLLNLNPWQQHQDTELWVTAEWERHRGHITEVLGFGGE